MISISEITEEPQDEPTGEVLLYRRYIALGRTSSDADAERKAIKESEIEPLMADGVVFGENGRYLKHSYDTRVDFDWKRAMYDGVIPKDKALDYLKVQTIRVLRDTKMDEDEAEVQAAMNRIYSFGPRFAEFVQEIFGSLNTDQQETAGKIFADLSGIVDQSVIDKVLEKIKP